MIEGHEYIRCPYCKYKFEHSESVVDVDLMSNQHQEVACLKCQKDFFVWPKTTVLYYTFQKAGKK